MEPRGEDKIDEPKLPPIDLRKRMIDFIMDLGGAVPFDIFMHESILGEYGYYERGRANIDTARLADFRTNSSYPEFAETVSEYWQRGSGQNSTFVEIGGGPGNFKRNFLNLNPDSRFISVEAASEFARAQSSLDANNSNSDTINGSITELPLPDNSIEGTIFSNELLDELPCKVLRVCGNERQGIGEEGIVYVKNNQLAFGFTTVSKNENIDEFEQYLNETGGLKPGAVYSVSPQSLKAISEINRVLKSGEALFFDYGYDNRFAKLRSNGQRHLPFSGQKNNEFALYSTLEHPYLRDITYSVDFHFFEWLAKKHFPQIESRAMPEAEVFDGIDVASLSRLPKLKERWHLGKISFGCLRLQK